MIKQPVLKFSINYFLFTIILFVTELLIALFINDDYIRPFGGDVLVVILIYCFLKSFLNLSPLKVALPVLLFAFIIEVLQYYHFVDYLGLRQHKVLAIALGSSFSWKDFVAYILGFFIILILERVNPISN